MRQLLLAQLVLLALTACSTEASPAPAKTAPTGPLVAFATSSAPAGAASVLETRRAAKPGAEVTVVGRAKDFVGGRAVFSLIDSSLRACSDEGDPMADTCETPWDYCCIDPREVTEASLTVEFRDATGLIKSDVQGVGGLDHLDTVYASGVAETDDSGNLTVVARSYYFEKNTR